MRGFSIYSKPTFSQKKPNNYKNLNSINFKAGKWNTPLSSSTQFSY